MNEDHHVTILILDIIGVLLVVGCLVLGLTGGINRFFFRVHKINEVTDYQTIRTVEDTCRAMIANYTADELTWKQYKESDVPEQVAWANQARMRANATAAHYNEYIIKNSFVWADNVPPDIAERLNYLE